MVVHGHEALQPEPNIMSMILLQLLNGLKNSEDCLYIRFWKWSHLLNFK